MQDKRLGIEIAALRQNLWRAPGQLVGMPWLDEDKPEETTDSCRWIDTSVMLCDAFTKKMKPDALVSAMKTGCWNIAQPESAKKNKEDKSASRRKSKNAKLRTLAGKKLKKDTKTKGLDDVAAAAGAEDIDGKAEEPSKEADLSA